MINFIDWFHLAIPVALLSKRVQTNSAILSKFCSNSVLNKDSAHGILAFQTREKFLESYTCLAQSPDIQFVTILDYDLIIMCLIGINLLLNL